MNRQTLISFYFLLYHIHYHICNAVVKLQPPYGLRGIPDITDYTFPWCFPGISRVFPGCFLGVPEHFFCTLLLLLKIIPTTFVKEVFILKHASLIQNLSKCSFPGCFPGDSWQMEFPLISSIMFGAMFFMI